MKRLFALSVCLLLATAVSASAEKICVTSVTAGGIGISATWDDSMEGTSGYDVVTIYLTQLPTAEAANSIQAIKGAWTTDGDFYVNKYAATSAGFITRTAQNYWNQFSVVNFGTTSGTFAREAGTDTLFWSNLIAGTWNNGGSSDQNLRPTPVEDMDFDDLNENVIAVLRVSPETTAINFGDGTDASQFGYSGFGHVINTAFSVVIPEPTTLALLGCGLFGLLAYAWRKRK